MKNMRFSKKLLIGAVSSLALFWSACSTSASDASDEDEAVIGKVIPGDDKSSSKDNEEDDDSTGNDNKSGSKDSGADDSQLTAPSDLSVSRLAPSVWELDISYSGDDGKKFVIQRMAPNASKWEDFDSLSVDVQHKLLDGASNSGFYYRVAAKNGSRRSNYSPEIWLDESVAYESDLKPVPPTVTPNILQDSVLELVITGNYPSTSMINSAYNKNSKGKVVGEVFYQARFVYGSEYSVDTVKFSIDKASLSKRFNSTMDQCNSFAQVRVVWKDKNGVTDYSEWTSPMGTKTGTTNGLVNTNNRCADTEQMSAGEFALPVPSNLTANQMENKAWVLSWDFEQSADRPEKGFKVQKLDLNTKKWVDYDSTGVGVTHLQLKSVTEAFSYYRVCAYDAKGRSDYSGDVLVALENLDDAKLADMALLPAPTNIAAMEMVDKSWVLSWEYTSSSKRAETGFYIQKLDLTSKKWVDLDKTSAGVTRFQLKDLTEAFSYYRVCAYDAKGRSEYSSDVLVALTVSEDEINFNGEELLLAAPTNLVAKAMSDKTWMLSWDYTASKKRAESGFIVEKMNLGDHSWTEIARTKAGVKRFQLTKVMDLFSYYRVAAYDAKGVSNYSEDVEIELPADSTGAVISSLSAPTNVKLLRIAPSVWEFSWDYNTNRDDPNTHFILQTSKYEEPDYEFKWKNFVDPLASNTRVYLIRGLENLESYYRIAMTDGVDTSVFSPTIQLTPSIPYREDVDPATPVFSMRALYTVSPFYEIDMDTTSKDSSIVGASIEFLMTENFINKNIYFSDFTDTVYYEARWFNATFYDEFFDTESRLKVFHGMDEDNVRHYERTNLGESWIEPFRYEEPAIKLSFNQDDEIKVGSGTRIVYDLCVAQSGYDPSQHLDALAGDKEIMLKEQTMAACLKSYASTLCGYSVQIRVVWKDKFGETDYSEWTAPTGVRDMDGGAKLCGE